MPYGESYDKDQYDGNDIPDAIPDGWYPVRIADVTKETVGETDVPMANVRFSIRGGDFEGQNIFRRFPLPIGDIPEGKKIQYQRFLVPFLEAIGAPKQGMKPDAWIGTELWVRVKVETFAGAKDAKVVEYSAENPTKVKK